jgi:hypothetical protein
MEERNTFRLFFCNRKDRIDTLGKSNVNVHISVNGEHTAFSINCKADADSWDVSKGSVKLKAKNASEINAFIQAYKNRAYDAYRQLLDEQRIVTLDKNQWYEPRGKPRPQIPHQAAGNLPAEIKDIIHGKSKRNQTLQEALLP